MYHLPGKPGKPGKPRKPRKNAPGGKYAPSTDDGIRLASDLPDNFPDDVPVYPESAATASLLTPLA